MKRWMLIPLLVVLLPGCVCVRPSDRQLIDTHAANAAAMTARADEDAAVPDAYRRWIAAEAKTWRYLSDWANGRKPSGGDSPGED